LQLEGGLLVDGVQAKAGPRSTDVALWSH